MLLSGKTLAAGSGEVYLSATTPAASALPLTHVNPDYEHAAASPNSICCIGAGIVVCCSTKPACETIR